LEILEKLISITTDNAPTMISCINEIKSTLMSRNDRKFGDFLGVNCLGHIFHLIIGKLIDLDFDDSLNTTQRDTLSTKYALTVQQIKHIQTFRDILTKCRSIVGYFNHSDGRQKELSTCKTPDGKALKQLIQEVSTRWSSTYGMIKRIYERHGPINKVLGEVNKYNLILNENDIRILNESIAVFQPFSQATDILSADKYPTAGLALPIYYKIPVLLKDLVTDSLITKSIKYVLRKGMEINANKFKLDSNSYLVAATYLTPKYKLFNNMPNQLELRDTAENVIKELSKSIDT
jgi:hypothetical protein